VTIEKPITDIIDLTFTDKYYKPKQDDFAATKVTHHKFKIPGKKLPTPEMLKTIMDTMENLVKEKKVMGVHCTHGINRTGYIICTFMVERLGWEPQAAIDAFGVARGIPIQHQEYIDAVLGVNKTEAQETLGTKETQEAQQVQKEENKNEKIEPQPPSPVEEKKE
jgi:atypical dual specificity phosphatase